MSKIVIAAQDPGGAESIAPVIIELAKAHEVLVLAANQSKAVFGKHKIKFVNADGFSSSDLNQVLIGEQADLVFTATSHGRSIEKELLKLAKQQNIPSLSVIDFWANYAARFSLDDSLDVLPNLVCTLDEVAKQEMIAEGIDASRIVVTGNPQFDALLSKKIDSSQNEVPVITYFSQPVELVFGDASSEKFLGYTETQVLRELLEELNKIDSPFVLKIRKHPKESVEKFGFALDRSYVQLDEGEDFRSSIQDSDLLMGMFSMALFEGVLMGKPVISYQPNLKVADMLKSNTFGWSTPVYQKAQLRSVVEEKLNNPAAGTIPTLQGDATAQVVKQVESLLPGVVESEEESVGAEKLKVVCIIQTRMGSTRLPGKVLKPLADKPVLWHVINRVKAAPLVDEVVIATTTHAQDDIVAEKAVEFGAKVFRGSEDNVLSRYVGAAREANADIVIRVTSDCPLVDPEVINKMITKFIALGRDQVDYMTNREKTYPRGLDAEIFWKDILDVMDEKAVQEYEQEHVTPYIYHHPEEFTIVQFDQEEDHSKHRWTLDTPEDYALLSKIYDELYTPDTLMLQQDVLKAFDEHPDWFAINHHIEQKKVRNVAKVEKIAVVGCGYAGERHIRLLKTFFSGEIIAVDLDAKKRDHIALTYNVETTADLVEVLNSVQAVIIATPTQLHVPLAMQCLSAGVHVLLEKPISHTMEGVNELVALAEEKKLVLFIGFNMRYYDILEQTKELLPSTEPLLFRSSFGSYLPWRHGKENAHEYTKDYACRKESGGGPVIDMIHEFDYTSWFFGEVEEVFAQTAKLSELEMNCEDTADVIIKFKNGVQGNIHLDFLEKPANRKLTVVGKKGTIKVDLSNKTLQYIYDTQDDWQEVTSTVDFSETYVRELEHFLLCVEGKQDPFIDGKKGKELLEIALAVHKSAATRAFVKVGDQT